MKIVARISLFLLIGIFCIAAIFCYISLPQRIPEPDILPREKLQCASYTPFVKNEAPYDFVTGLKISRERISADLKLLSEKFSCVRTYSMTGLEELPAVARQYGMQVYLGIWIGRNAKDNQKEINLANTVAKSYPEVVQGIIVGNEVLLRREQKASGLVALIDQVKKANPNVVVTYADVWEFWIQNPSVAEHVDMITIHILPYWENNPVGIDHAVQHVEDVYNTVVRVFPDKKILIGEVGWPSAGRPRSGAHPSPVNQARFIRGFVDLANKNKWNYNIIEAFDQPWKRMNEGAVGGYWGMYTTERIDKGVLSGVVHTLPGAKKYFEWASVLFFVAFALVWPRFLDLPNVQGQWQVLVTRTGGLLLIVLFAVSQALFLRESTLANRYWNEELESVLLFVISLCMVVHFFWRDDFEREESVNAHDDWSARLMGLAALLAVYDGLGLVFDGRYRVIPFWGYLIPGVICFAHFARQHHNKNISNLLLGLCLVLIAVAQLLLESVSNVEAGILSLEFMIMGLLLLVRNRQLILELRTSGFWRAVTPVITSLLLLIIVLLVRYEFMENEMLSAECADGNAIGLCGARAKIGVLIHFNFWSGVALLPVISGMVLNRPRWVLAGIVLSPLGLVLYNTQLAAMAFIIGIFSLRHFYRQAGEPSLHS